MPYGDARRADDTGCRRAGLIGRCMRARERECRPSSGCARERGQPDPHMSLMRRRERAFTPQSDSAYQGTLTIDGRMFNLTGQGQDPPLPSASIVFASSVAASAQQNTITIPLRAASQVSGIGTLTMAFEPSVTGVTNDAAIQFLSGPLRKATVSIAIGDTSAMIGGQPSISFQTGTTAGTITFTLTLPNATLQSSMIIPPSPTSLERNAGLTADHGRCVADGDADRCLTQRPG